MLVFEPMTYGFESECAAYYTTAPQREESKERRGGAER